MAALGLGLAAGCAGAGTQLESPVAKLEPPSGVETVDGVDGGGSPDAPAASKPRSECSDELGTELVRVSCDGKRILVAGPVELGPQRPGPEGGSKKILEQVAVLLRERPEILLIRIEVYARRSFGRDTEQNRALLQEAQVRADAILQWFYRRQGISAERLEAVGYPRSFDSEAQFPVVLRIVQRRAIENSSTAE